MYFACFFILLLYNLPTFFTFSNIKCNNFIVWCDMFVYVYWKQAYQIYFRLKLIFYVKLTFGWNERSSQHHCITQAMCCIFCQIVGRPDVPHIQKSNSVRTVSHGILLSFKNSCKSFRTASDEIISLLVKAEVSVGVDLLWRGPSRGGLIDMTYWQALLRLGTPAPAQPSTSLIITD